MRSLAALLAVTSALFAGSADAADTGTPAADQSESMAKDYPSWAIQVTPYLWAAGLDGTISPFRRGPAMGVEKSFSDVLGDLNFGAFVNIWGRYERFVLSGDFMYVDTTDAHVVGPLPPLPVPVPPGTVVNGSVDTTQFTATLQGGYRVLAMPEFTLDALAGARIWSISNDVTVSALGLSRTYGENFDWTDPVVGARVFARLGERLSLQAQADIGGFGAASKLTWSVLATINYTLSDHFSVSAGYKVLDVDYDRDGYIYDTRLDGLVLGFTYRF